MRAFTHYLLLAGLFLLVSGTLPIAVSAMYGGNPPPHIAKLTRMQMETFQTIAPMIFNPLHVIRQAIKP